MKETRNEYYSYIRERLSIHDICIALGIATKAVGDDYVGTCIYHNDPHPSMHIYSNTKSFYCYQCNRGGDIFTFLEGVLNCSFWDSVKWLEQQFPEILKERPVFYGKNDTGIRQNGFDIAYKAYEVMHEEEQDAFQVFAEKRGYEPDYLRERGIFFAKGRKLLKTYAAQPGHKTENIEEIEKLKEKQLLRALPMNKNAFKIRYEDYLKNDRIIITLKDLQGHIVGYAGRSVEEKQKPKYLFTKNLPKSQILYRLDYVERVLTQNFKTKKNGQQTLYIVEGMFDALRLEQHGLAAVAVMGSSLVKQQVALLETVVKQNNGRISLGLFLDSDEAGLNGTVESIKKLWKNQVLKKCYLSVIVLQDGSKDADEYFKNESNKNNKPLAYSGFEFLMRYFMREEEETIFHFQVTEQFQRMSVEERIQLLHRVEDILPLQEWMEVFEQYESVRDVYPDDSKTTDADFAYRRIYEFITGGNTGNKAGSSEASQEKNKNYLYRMQTALQIVRTSYSREEIGLDDSTWERIALGADAFFPQLYQMLRENHVFKMPMLTMMVPKKLNVQRKKAMFCHEELLVQQYILNELLTRGQQSKYELCIPAVRYQTGRGIYVTGVGYEDKMKEPVSFAYQIDMEVVSGTTEIKKGMYRPFFECWKSYIEYVQDGIKKLAGETVYRVKLDIQAFYDNIYQFVVRNALCKPVLEALKYDNDKFSFFRIHEGNRKGEVTTSEGAEKIVNWILGELYKKEYYDSSDGSLKIKEESDCGIPQGPDLSSYVANIVLFSVDKKACEIVERANKGCEDGKVRARYARYVDDMIIIASTPDLLLEIKKAVAAQLFELNLYLSPKTDPEDGISKEEAERWTLEERGGFGVSAGFDFADDSFGSLMEEYEEYEVSDRRTALKLMQSKLSALLYDGIEGQQAEFEQLRNVFFQTEDIRFQDIVRFSEMLLYYAEKLEVGIVEAFHDMWNEGLEKCKGGSLLLEEGLEILVLLDGCCNVLRRQNRNHNPDSYKAWKNTENKILASLPEVMDKVCHEVGKHNILQKNQWMIKLKLLELKGLARQLQDASTSSDGKAVYVKELEWLDSEKNAYWYRWEWHTKKTYQEFHPLFPKELAVEDSLFQHFHYCLGAFLRIQNENHYHEINSKMDQYRDQYNKGKQDDIFITCFRIWFNKNNTPAIEREEAEISLNILLNTITMPMKAEIVYRIDCLKDLLFAWNRIDPIQFLPVFPGVGYPGIMAMIKAAKSNHVTKVERLDFMNTSMQIPSMQEKCDWEPREGEEAGSEEERENKNTFYYTRTLVSQNYITLEDYFKEENGQIPSPVTVLNKIAELYLPMSEKLLIVKNPDQILILSKKNVLVKVENDTVDEIDVNSAYFVSREKTADVVGIEQGNGNYILQNVYEHGAAYWISGYLLMDACQFDRILLNARNKADDPTFCCAAEMLEYSMKRLYGYSCQKNRNRKKKSYEKSVKRTIKLIQVFLNCKELRELCLEDAKIINSLIQERMSEKQEQYHNIELEIAIWSKNYLRFGYRGLIQRIKEMNCPIQYAYEAARRVPRWYCYLADRIQELSGNREEFSGLRVLAAGLYADGIWMHLRMQVLETIRSLTRNEKDQFLLEAEELPLQELNLDEETVFVTEGSIQSVFCNLLNDKMDPSITKITHIGWLLLLAKLCEIDKSNGFILFARVIDREGVREEMCNVLAAVRQNCGKEKESKDTAQEKEKETKYEFPFEGMDDFFMVWHRNNVVAILQALTRIDNKCGTIVKDKVFSSSYAQVMQKKRVKIETEEDNFTELPYFLTYGKLNNNTSEVEHNMENESEFVYSESLIQGKVVGISTIDNEFGELLQLWEKKAGTAEPKPSDRYKNTEDGKEAESQEEAAEKEGLGEPGETEVPEHLEDSEIHEGMAGKKDPKIQEHSGTQEMLEGKEVLEEKEGSEQEGDAIDQIKPEDQENARKPGKSNGTGQCGKGNTKKVDGGPAFSISDQNLFRLIHEVQENEWGRRRVKYFKNTDRIALFQFKIDSSYKHPCAEKCGLSTASDHKTEELMEEGSPREKTDTENASCAEFRRRELLEPVMKACEQFEVEILLLPEYSVRPETVEWMKEKIRKEKFHFSIWAGTFRISPNYRFDGNGTIDDETLNERLYWHSAPLPVILNTSRKQGEERNKVEAEILIKKFKKYPSVALHEDINPTPAYSAFGTLAPIMLNYAKEKLAEEKELMEQAIHKATKEEASGKKSIPWLFEREIMPFFYDARDDVIELICAEFLALAAISNHPSFVLESLRAYSNYTNPLLIGNEEVFQEYTKKLMQDVKEFGEYTALYQRKQKYKRTPILLVPACTTRAVDYYVLGQGFYLASGIKTVFCNTVGTGGRGGSCFIGPDSWDDKKIVQDKFLMENTLYHGLKPGIYMQTAKERDRGALGDKEQALLICDINSEMDKKQPNSESMLNTFSLVAHIPILEEDLYPDNCQKNKSCSYCYQYEVEKAEKRRKSTEEELFNICTYCKEKKEKGGYKSSFDEGSDNRGSFGSGNMKNGKDPLSCREDENEGSGDTDGAAATRVHKEDVVKALIELGETYQSAWLKKRAGAYAEFCKLYPQGWSPPALLDWLYVKINYHNFQENKEEYLIQMPPYQDS